jgi:hypothetical protein
VLSKFNFKDATNDYILSVVTPRLGRMPKVSADVKRELVEKFAARLKQIEDKKA